MEKKSSKIEKEGKKEIKEGKKEIKEGIEEKEIKKEENLITEKKKRRHKGECSKCGKIHFNCFCCEDPESCPIHGHI